MILHKIKPWRRNQSRKLPDEIKRFEDHMRSPVSPLMPQNTGRIGT